jgi:hypothetical protein
MTHDLDPTQAALDQADALEEQGKHQEALALLLQFESLGNPIILTRIGALQYELERWDESEATLLKAIKADSKYMGNAFLYWSCLSRPGPLRDGRSCLSAGA